MNHMRRRRAWGVVLVGAACLLPGCARQPARTVTIREPVEGVVIAGPKIHVVLEAAGIEIVPAAQQRPGTAHHHLFLDTELTPPGDTIPSGVTGIIHLGRAQTEFTFDSVAPGSHRLIALLADPWHIPLKPLVADTVTVTVQ